MHEPFTLLEYIDHHPGLAMDSRDGDAVRRACELAVVDEYDALPANVHPIAPPSEPNGKEDLENITKDEVQLNIEEVPDPDTNAQLVAVGVLFGV